MFLELLEKNEQLKIPFLEKRKLARDKAKDIGFPNKKTEAFSYVNLKHIDLSKTSFSTDDYRITTNSAKVEILSLQDAVDKYGVLITNRLEKALSREKSFFSLVNHGWNSHTICIFLNASVEETIVIEEEFVGDNKGSCPQLQFFIQKGCHAKFHHKIKVNGKNNFVNRSVYTSLEKEAKVSFYETLTVDSSTTLFTHTEALIKGNASFFHFSGISGCKLFRNEIKAYLLEEEASASLQGFWNGCSNDNIHNHVHCSHLAESTYSNQQYQGVVDDKAKASFEGQIYVDKVAQKTDSYQLSKHLLLGEDAKGFSKPNLEVFADDVKASHGATISMLNEDELYYLTSRGISKDKAASLLKQGFLSFFLEQINDKEVCKSFSRLIKQ